MSNSTFDMAISNAKKLGRCLGTMVWVIRYGELNNSDWKLLARTYVGVSDENEWNQDEFDYIREEAIRRGVDIGE
jgi:hypothetical protein